MRFLLFLRASIEIAAGGFLLLLLYALAEQLHMPFGINVVQQEHFVLITTLIGLLALAFAILLLRDALHLFKRLHQRS